MWLVVLFTMSQAYTFKYRENVVVTVNEPNKYKAFKLASKMCYNNLTKGVYPGEERGLEIIDICVNPYYEGK